MWLLALVIQKICTLSFLFRKRIETCNLLDLVVDVIKNDLQVLHLNYCPYGLNLENFQYKNHHVNIAMKM